jgi:hypothetical protein
MALEDIVDLTITVTSATLTRPGFGTPLLLVSSVPAGWGANLTRQFSKLSELTDLGFTSSDPAYKLAQKIKSQNPAPRKFKIGKRTNAPSQSLQVLVASAADGTYSVKVGVGGGTKTTCALTAAAASMAGNPDVTFAEVGATGDTITRATGSFVTDGFYAGMLITVADSVSNNFASALCTAVSATVLTLDTQDLAAEGPVGSVTITGAHTTSSIATALEALIEAVTGVSSSASTATITVTPATAGTLVNLESWTSNLRITDATADPGVSTDLDDILEVDTDWYGLLLDSNSQAEVEAAAEWTEANKKLFGYSSSDYGCTDSGSTTDVFYTTKAAAYTRSFGIYNGNELLGYSAAAWMGRGLAYDPGKITWAFKTLAGVTVDSLATGVRSAIEAKNGNHYETVAGKNQTWEGKLSSGEYIDITHFLDWLDAEMRLQVYAALSGPLKLPYTKLGAAQIEATVKSVLKAGVRAGGLVDDENLFVTVPDVDDVDSTTRANRVFPDVEFGARLAGAIHKTIISGSVSA